MRPIKLCSVIMLAVTLGGCTVPKIPFDRSAAGHVRTIGIVTPGFPSGPSVELASSVGQSFGLIGALVGATSAATGFAGAQTQYQAAMAAKSAQYSTYAGYNYGALAPRFNGENREGTRQVMRDRAHAERDAREKAQREWESAAKKTASEFEAAAEKAAAAFEGALRKVPGLFDSSSVTGEQMAGAAAGVSQEVADNYLRRRAGGGAGEDGFLLRQPAGHGFGVVCRHGLNLVRHRRIPHRPQATGAGALDAMRARRAARHHRRLGPVSYTHLRAHETVLDLVCRLLLEKKKAKEIVDRLTSQLQTEEREDTSGETWRERREMASDITPRVKSY